MWALDPACSYYVESINQTWNKPVAPFLRTNHCKIGVIYWLHQFERLRPRNTQRATYTLVIPQVVPLFHIDSLLLVSSSSVDVLLFNILKKFFLSLKIFSTHSRFFFFLYFHRTLPVTSHFLQLILCSFPATIVCLITHSFLHWFQPNCYQCLCYVSSTCQTIFRLKQIP